jgi:hypothetical protein
MGGDVWLHVFNVSILARCGGLIRLGLLKRCDLTRSGSFACHDVATKASFSVPHG